jgi:hypothetical protein
MDYRNKYNKVVEQLNINPLYGFKLYYADEIFPFTHQKTRNKIRNDLISLNIIRIHHQLRKTNLYTLIYNN